MSNEGKPGEVLHAVFGWINKAQYEYIRKLEKENGAGNGGSMSHEQYLRMYGPSGAQNSIIDYKSPFVSPLESLSSDKKIADLQSEMKGINERIDYIKELVDDKISKVKHGLEFWLIMSVISLVAIFSVYAIVN